MKEENSKQGEYNFRIIRKLNWTELKYSPQIRRIVQNK